MDGLFSNLRHQRTYFTNQCRCIYAIYANGIYSRLDKTYLVLNSTSFVIFTVQATEYKYVAAFLHLEGIWWRYESQDETVEGQLDLIAKQRTWTFILPRLRLFFSLSFFLSSGEIFVAWVVCSLLPAWGISMHVVLLRSSGLLSCFLTVLSGLRFLHSCIQTQ